MSQTGPLRKHVLLVEDDEAVRGAMAAYFRRNGMEVSAASSCATAIEAFHAVRPDVVIADHVLPDGTSSVLLPKLRELDPEVPVLLLTGHGSVEMAVQALRHGATDVLTKPLPLDTLLARVRAAYDETDENPRHSLVRSAVRARRPAALDPSNDFLGDSPPVRRLREQLRAISSSECSVLIVGETGTGKGVAARALHRASRRASGPFRDVNCATLSRELVESELFGHARGAFTGAHTAKAGLFEAASGGTLFLDEIGDVDLSVQPKLLTAIEDRRVRRVGEVHDRAVDVRLVAATHHDLLSATRRRSFRGDLFYRISTLRLDIPPLRERGADIVLLARAFLAAAGERHGRGELRLDPAAEQILQRHPWPGNIRELRNVIDRAAVAADGTWVRSHAIQLDRMPSSAPPPERGAAQQPTLEDVERRHVRAVLEAEGGDVGSAARRLGIARSTLYAKMRLFGIDPSAARRVGGSGR